MRQLAADTDQEYRTQFFGNSPLTAFGIQLRVTLQQGFAVNKVDLLRQERG
ncbi:hypothetical protein D3C79_1025040 [compost metagenome]